MTPTADEIRAKLEAMLPAGMGPTEREIFLDVVSAYGALIERYRAEKVDPLRVRQGTIGALSQILMENVCMTAHPQHRNDLMDAMLTMIRADCLHGITLVGAAKGTEQ